MGFRRLLWASVPFRRLLYVSVAWVPKVGRIRTQRNIWDEARREPPPPGRTLAHPRGWQGLINEMNGSDFRYGVKMIGRALGVLGVDL